MPLKGSMLSHFQNAPPWKLFREYLNLRFHFCPSGWERTHNMKILEAYENRLYFSMILGGKVKSVTNIAFVK